MADALDAFVRQQVYVEGFKNGEVDRASATFDEISAAVLLLATQAGITNLGELTKRDMLAFVAQVKAKVKSVFNKSAEVTLANIEQFMGADIAVTGKVLSAVSDAAIPYNSVNLSWGSAANTPIAGVGTEPNELVSAQLTAIIAAYVAAIKRGYADSQTLADFTRELVGTKALKFKDGLSAKLQRNWATAIETIIQHVSSLVAFKLQSLASKTYTWCSILDSRTTDICRERNGQVYEYRNGPRPPAHWRCRSFVVPITVVALQDMPTFYTWAKRQPASIQDDIFGPTRGRELRTGVLKADDLPGFDRTRPLTVNEYAGKVDQILNEVA